MPRLRLSNSNIGKVQPPPFKDNGQSTNVLYRDDQLQGFGLLVTSRGAKSFFVEKRVNGKNRRLTIGRFGQVTPVQARKKAQELLGEMAMGNDPLEERRDKAARSVTLGEAYREYLQTRKNLKPNTLHDYKRCIEGALGDWLTTPLSELSKDKVEKRHRALGKKSKARANNTMRVLRAIFNFAMDRYEDKSGKPIILFNPVSRISSTRGWYEIKRRQTLLTPTQLKPWFEATLKLNQETTRDYLHFLLFTGLRRSEAALLTWEDIDFNEKVIHIPDTKNKEPHALPMSDFLKDLLKRRKKMNLSEWVFPSPRTLGPLKEPKTALKRIETVSGIKIRLHDLRRTFITIAESLDIPAYALKRLLNHKFSNDVTAGYIVPSTERLRAPMQRITDYLMEKIQG
ncbi:MAG: integrase [Gammaproteobacteria bacterium]|nr:integrase [Gammaproteobacteria bacterium]|tara:strand:- start:3064 stop:4260 length:1197 start_codon:yes stop_codon:yes gene_type:complete